MVQTSLKHQEKPSEYLIYSPLLHIITNRPPSRYFTLNKRPVSITDGAEGPVTATAVEAAPARAREPRQAAPVRHPYR